jgi:hypothetical protein
VTRPALARPAPAICASALVAAAALLAVSAPAHAWRRPVPGPVARAFAYSAARPFVAGQHRGADFAASPGAAVRAACSGRVVFAGRGVVTLRCGRWRVTHLPLAAFAVHAGARVRAGGRLGTLAASREHAGLHLGVRRAGDRFAYVDPVPLLGPEIPRVGPPGLASRRAPPRDAPPHVRVAAPSHRRVAAPPHVRVAAPVQLAVRTRPAAIWPVWLGLALALAGAVGGGIRIRVRKRRMLIASVVSRT